MSDESKRASDYASWLGDLKARIRSARTAAARTINRELILLYWDIGRRIAEKQQQLGWGKSVVEQLSSDLKSEFPETTGLSADNLWRMRQFFSEYSSGKFLEQVVPENANRDAREILEQPVPELLQSVPWGHHVEIMKKVKTPPERIYYLHATAQFGWTR